MKVFTVYFKEGVREILVGDDIIDALLMNDRHLDYAFYYEGLNTAYKYNKETCKWDKKAS